MKLKTAIFILTIAFALQQLQAQVCTTLGQNPSSAFPVCGTNTFTQDTVPYCGGRDIPGPCSQDGLKDLNPFWYKFTCYTPGTLGFKITPFDLNDDYDWQIFDITGHNPNDIYTDASLFVACNWSGNTGATGTNASGASLKDCAGYTYPTFSKMPSLKFGHDYILLVSHFTTFTPSQNGYTLSFGGGTAVITDPLLPDMKEASASCDGTVITVVLNKKMKCASLAANGSDFTLSGGITILSAASNSCKANFDMDTLQLGLGTALSPGNYTLTIGNGSDNNTLLDNCDRNIVPGNKVQFQVLPLQPTAMDSLTTPACAPQTMHLVFKKNILCSSIATDGSDFIITGPSLVKVNSAAGNCINGSSTEITLNLAGPLVVGGNYQLKLLSGSDGNTIINECGQQTPAGSFINFALSDTVSAAFTYQVSEGCTSDIISFFHNGKNGVNNWLWNLDYAGNSIQQNPLVSYNTFTPKTITLSVSNGLCSDTATQVIALGNELKASFEVTNILCPEDTATFVNKSIGNIVSYTWDLGDGTISNLPAPLPEHYPVLSAEQIYTLRLVVKNNAGCFDTAYNNIKVLKSCYIAVPTAFTPNGDGLNDYLYPLNAFKADGLDFRVYDRRGNLVFHSTDWTAKWDGRIKGEPQDTGVYVWLLRYTNHDTGKKVFQKGSSILIR
ncbi:MAG: gliding motility-associated C-terminal domain-containing protein [Bacteroidota bacterium]|nr:gliding motility-associated C-terminal domain-containing protein [Bacteroidota bacterium]